MNNDRQKKVLEIIRNEMSSEERKENDLNLETGEPSWLTTLAIKEAGYILNKQSFWICYPSSMDGDWNKFYVIVHVVIHLICNTLSSIHKESFWLYAMTNIRNKRRTC